MRWFTNLKITNKLSVGLGAIMLVLLVFAIFTYIQNKRVEAVAREATLAYERTVKLREVQTELLDMSSLVRGVLVTADDYLTGIYGKTSKAFDADIEKLIKLYEGDPDGQAIARDLKKTVNSLRDNVYKKQLSMMGDPDRHEAARKMEIEGDSWPFIEKVLINVDKATERQRKLLQEKEAAMQAAYARQTWVIVGATAVALALAVALAVGLSRAIGSPIMRITGTMLQLADRKLDLDIPHTKRADEIGDMGRAVEVFRDNMKSNEEMAAERERRQQAELDKAKRLEDLTNRFDNSVGEVLGHVEEANSSLRDRSRDLHGLTSETKDQSVTVVSAANQASTNVQTVASATEELLASIKEISSQASKSSSVAGEASQVADDTRSTVRELAEAADRIGEVVSLITDIAEQTNLLALNATIEAARAGEAGKGFAVVANEVKSLASQTAKATDEISGQISGIQGTTRNSVQAMERISEIITEITEIAGGIASAVEEQAAATQEISQNVNQASTGTNQVTEAMAQVNDSCEKTGSSASSMQETVKQLTDYTERLNTEVRGFLTEVKKTG